MKNKLNFTLQKIGIVTSVLCVLVVSFAVPVSASILPGENAVYSNSVGYSGFENISATFDGANGYDFRIYTTEEFTKDNVNNMGTNDVYDVAKPCIMLPVNTICTDRVFISFGLPESLFVNEYNSGNVTGYYRVRFGVYLRAYGNVSGNAQFDSSATYFQGEAVSNESVTNGTYIGTGSAVRGTYHYFDFTVYFDENKADTVGMIVIITPMDKSVGTSDEWIRFTGSDPKYYNSFISFTPIYVERYAIGANTPPYTQGTIIRYTNDVNLLLDTYEIVGNTYLNPFTQEIETAGMTSVLYTSSSYPGIGYYFVPAAGAQYGGFLYKVYLLSNTASDYLQTPSGNIGQYSQGFEEGYQSATNYYESIIKDKDDLYNNLLKSYGTKWEYAYQQGYSEGSYQHITNRNEFLMVLDRAGNLVRNCISPIMDIGIFGVSISTAIGVCVLSVIAIVIIKKAR